MASERERSRSPNRMETNSSPSDWKCNNCSSDNKEDRTDCRKCRLSRDEDKQKVFKDDWECPSCRANNYSRRLDCFKCHKKKPPADPRFPNDWTCPGCQGNNYSKRMDCYKCKTPKPQFVSSQSADWNCGCGASNFSRRVTCYKCNMGRGAPPPNRYDMDSRYEPRGGYNDRGRRPMRSPTPDRHYRSRSPICEPVPDVDPFTGESQWHCPICGVSNFYKRPDCFRCYEKKPGTVPHGDAMFRSREPSQEPGYLQPREDVTTYHVEQPTARFVRERSYQEVHQNRARPQFPPPQKRFSTDWICENCNGLNFSKRVDCYKCHDPKPADENSGAGGGDTGNSKYPNDWRCNNCGGNNFSRRLDCFKCQQPKSNDEADLAQ